MVLILGTSTTKLLMIQLDPQLIHSSAEEILICCCAEGRFDSPAVVRLEVLSLVSSGCDRGRWTGEVLASDCRTSTLRSNGVQPACVTTVINAVTGGLAQTAAAFRSSCWLR